MEAYRDNESYGRFADIYERLMADVPYDEWTGRIMELLAEGDIRGGLCADLACGTGSITRRLLAKGFDMIGIDISEEMLRIAREREMTLKGSDINKDTEEERQEILYLQQDIRSFELYGTVRAVICACDSINYILRPDEVEQVLSLVNNYLDPGGMLILDFHTPYYFSEVLGEETITEVDDDMALIWENEERGNGEHISWLTVFTKEKDESYSRFEEEHLQRGYTIDEMRKLAENAGLKEIHFYDGYSALDVREDSERIVMTARENGK